LRTNLEIESRYCTFVLGALRVKGLAAPPHFKGVCARAQRHAQRHDAQTDVQAQLTALANVAQFHPVLAQSELEAMARDQLGAVTSVPSARAAPALNLTERLNERARSE
jgi:hypothetical protein